MMKKNRWLACLCVCGLLCGVLCACGDVKPTVSEPNSAPMTTSTTTMSTTSTETTTTTTTKSVTTTTSQTSIKYKQFYCNFLGERVLMTYERVMSLSSSYPVQKSDNNWIIVNNDKIFCVAEDVEKGKDLDLWRYNGQLSDGTRLYCYVQVNSKKIYQYYHSGSGHRVYGENDELAMQKRVKNWLDVMGYHCSEADIEVMMQGEKAKQLGHFAYVFVYNEKDGGIWMNVQKMREGWCIFEMHLSVDNILNEPEWIA